MHGGKISEKSHCASYLRSYRRSCFNQLLCPTQLGDDIKKIFAGSILNSNGLQGGEQPWNVVHHRLCIINVITNRQLCLLQKSLNQKEAPVIKSYNKLVR